MSKSKYEYCQDFCPIYQPLKEFNEGARRSCEELRCPDGFCEQVISAVMAKHRRWGAEKRKGDKAKCES